ncbi:glycosyltransferase family 4 protein [Lascolabacillus massiliensis]|uniref:glycosyltransferase family 4 protein n=1 Tax=Lascolabacillus massiliensis TaxID=1627894 RepID=UPI0006B36C38|nr:glycosyltransferase family 4 protein [Lascolabacillus massiliensis]
MKIAILSTGSTNNRKGVFNSVHGRIKHLKALEDVEVDVYLIQHYDSWLFRLVRKRFKPIDTKRAPKEGITTIDGVSYRNLWVEHKMIDYILSKKLKLKDISCKSQLGQFVDLFKDYDLLSVHALPDKYIAYLVKQKYGIPFVTTWHGSDINVWPFVNKEGFKTTKLIIENADFNFFVSRRLMHTSDKITKKGKKDYLYSGPADIYLNPPQHSKEYIRNELNISTKYLVGFIGNIVSIKNVMVLPDIFRIILNKIHDVSFIIVGDGKLLDKLKVKILKYKIQNVKFTGKLDPEQIPDIMNSLDLLLLPSLNEGLPLVTLEALSYGVPVVGSNVGGISESIGEENCFNLDDDFLKNISTRAIEILENGEKPKQLSKEFLWETTLEKEMSVYKKVLQKEQSI